MTLPANFQSFLVACAVSLVGISCADLAGDENDKEKESLVRMTIDFGDGFQKRYTAIPWTENMTVLDAMNYAKSHPRGIQFEIRGKKSTALLTSLDQVKNRGNRGLNWLFRVNQELGDRSFAVYRLKAGDEVLWKFDAYK